MNRLQKSAWINLARTTIIIIIAGLGFWLMTSLNAKGLHHILIFIISASLVLLIKVIVFRKRSIEAHFDERERKIYANASLWSYGILMLFLICMCIIPFYIVGGKNCVPAYYLPIILLGSIYIGQFTQSAVILIRCLLEEQENE